MILYLGNRIRSRDGDPKLDLTCSELTARAKVLIQEWVDAWTMRINVKQLYIKAFNNESEFANLLPSLIEEYTKGQCLGFTMFWHLALDLQSCYDQWSTATTEVATEPHRPVKVFFPIGSHSLSKESHPVVLFSVKGCFSVVCQSK